MSMTLYKVHVQTCARITCTLRSTCRRWHFIPDSISDRLDRQSILDATTNRTYPRASDYNAAYNAEQQEWESRRAVMLDHARNQELVCKLTEEIKKTVNESMEGVVNGLRNEVTEDQS